MLAKTYLTLSFRINSTVLELKRENGCYTENNYLRHDSETYEFNLCVLEAVEKLEVKEKTLSCLEIRDFIFGQNNSPARALVHRFP